MCDVFAQVCCPVRARLSILLDSAWTVSTWCGCNVQVAVLTMEHTDWCAVNGTQSRFVRWSLIFWMSGPLFCCGCSTVPFTFLGDLRHWLSICTVHLHPDTLIHMKNFMYRNELSCVTCTVYHLASVFWAVLLLVAPYCTRLWVTTNLAVLQCRTTIWALDDEHMNHETQISTKH
jgi:hypothetical protein